MTRSRRRGVDEVRMESARCRYREARHALKKAIRAAKISSWELVRDLDRDPWRRPYKIVLSKLRPWAPPISEIVKPVFLESIVRTLFPDFHPFGMGEPYLNPPEPPFPRWNDEELGVSCVEVGKAVGKIKRRKAPSPDGVPGWVLAAVVRELPGQVGETLPTVCDTGGFRRHGRKPKWSSCVRRISKRAIPLLIDPFACWTRRGSY